MDDESGDALGTARLITAGSSPVKTLVDVAGEPWHLPVADSLATAGLAPATVWDVASLAVAPGTAPARRVPRSAPRLCHGIWRYARNCGVPGLVTILDDRVRRLVRAMGLPWYPMAGATSQPYLGSPASTPCVFVVRTAEEEVYGARPDLAPSLDHGVFRSIVVDPADLVPTRGTVVHETMPAGRPERSLPLRRDTTGWRPPTSRHADLSASPPGA